MGKKIVVESTILDTSKNKLNTEKFSDSEIYIKKLLNEKVLGGIMIVGIDEKNKKTTLVTLRALNQNFLKNFEERLSSASISYEIKTKPIWMNNYYFLEIIIKQ